MNFWRRFTGDFARDTAHLTLEQCGAYDRTLDHYYTTEKPLPLNKQLLYRVTRAESRSERAAVDFVLKEFYTKTPIGYTHKRVIEEIEYANSRAEAARQNGRLGGRPRKKGNLVGFSEEPRGNPAGFSGGKPSGVPSKNPEHNPEKSSPDSRLQTSEGKSKSPCPPLAEVITAAAVSAPAMELANLLQQLRLENDPRAKITARQVHDWGVTADLMFRLDHRTPEEIRALIEWSQRDSFWRSNILSMGKVRDRFDQLQLKRESSREKEDISGKRPGGDSTQDHLARFQRNLKIAGLDCA